MHGSGMDEDCLALSKLLRTDIPLKQMLPLVIVSQLFQHGELQRKCDF